MLSFLGYHVGDTQPTARDIRWRVLEYAFEYHLPPLNGPDYFLRWSNPRTPHRLCKLANTLAALARNAKGRDAVSFASAIEDWECDLASLREKYYVDFFRFGWPTTHPEHCLFLACRTKVIAGAETLGGHQMTGVA